MIGNLRSIYREFPKSFWILIFASYIDVIGRSSVTVFFALYVTQRFNVGMTKVGGLLALFAIAGMVGSTVGGALTDHLGRRGVIVFGLITSALATLSFAFIPTIEMFYPVIVLAGLFSNFGGPAQGAMVADLLIEEKRAQGFGIWRVAANLGWLTGPILGGLLADYAIILIFVLDATVSLLAAAIVLRAIPESRPPREDRAIVHGGIVSSFKGYGVVMRDFAFLAFIIPSVLAGIAYQQSYAPLTVYLQDFHSLSAKTIGSLFSLDALFVVALQFPFIRWAQKRGQFVMMAFGMAVTGVGLALYGAVSGYPLFVVARLAIATGEMIWMPTGQALATRFAPEHMRGRYMAYFGLTFGIATAASPLLGGMIMDHFDPRWLWYVSGLISATSVLGFWILHRKAQQGRLIVGTETKSPDAPPADH
ncbi:MFS transporter [Candidatus Bipolaricaulota bacterium]|nr:MFS transporter [Candidatus Bipolaricaulota bacterium]